MEKVNLYNDDCIKQLKKLKDNTIDSIVTDPPYGLSKKPNATEVLQHWLNGDDYAHSGGGFMGKSWDSFVPGPSVWKECYRVLKPGGHMLVFFGSRTYDLGCMAIRLANFEIRDQIMWVYGQGFPKSQNIGKMIDKKMGVEREVVGIKPGHEGFAGSDSKKSITRNTGSQKEFDRPWMHDEEKRKMYHMQTAPGSDEAKQWDGWGTALKPSHEPIVVARKPLDQKTVADNVMTHGAGGLNIDGCRIPTKETITNHSRSKESSVSKGKYGDSKEQETHQTQGQELGRYPANLIHDGSNEVLQFFPTTKSGTVRMKDKKSVQEHDSAARFFYSAKANKNDREEGLEHLKGKFSPTMGNGIGAKEHDPDTAYKKKNIHPTVKPTNLMAYLVRLVTPPNGIVLDPFMGSGSTGKAAIREGFVFTGIELDKEYFLIAKQRIDYETQDSSSSPRPTDNTLNDFFE